MFAPKLIHSMLQHTTTGHLHNESSVRLYISTDHPYSKSHPDDSTFSPQFLFVNKSQVPIVSFHWDHSYNKNIAILFSVFPLYFRSPIHNRYMPTMHTNEVPDKHSAKKHSHRYTDNPNWRERILLADKDILHLAK